VFYTDTGTGSFLDGLEPRSKWRCHPQLPFFFSSFANENVFYLFSGAASPVDWMKHTDRQEVGGVKGEDRAEPDWSNTIEMLLRNGVSAYGQSASGKSDS